MTYSDCQFFQKTKRQLNVLDFDATVHNDIQARVLGAFQGCFVNDAQLAVAKQKFLIIVCAINHERHGFCREFGPDCIPFIVCVTKADDIIRLKILSNLLA